MASQPETRPGIRQERARRADDGQPLHSEKRHVLESGHSLVIGVTAFAVKAHQVDKGEEATVEIYPDGVWIDFGEQDE